MWCPGLIFGLDKDGKVISKEPIITLDYYEKNIKGKK